MITKYRKNKPSLVSV